MFKLIGKVLMLGFVIAVIAAVANLGRLQALADRWKEQQQQRRETDTLKNWDQRIDAALGDLGGKLAKQAKLRRKHQALARQHEAALDRAKEREAAADALIARFVEKLKAVQPAEQGQQPGAGIAPERGPASFVFAGRRYTSETGTAQLERYLREMRGIQATIEREQELAQAERQVAGEFGEVLQGLDAQIEALRARAAAMKMERDRVRVAQETAALRALASDGGRAAFAKDELKRVDRLFALAQEDLVARRAEIGASGEGSDAPQSLDATVAAESRLERDASLDSLYEKYWNAAGDK